MPKLTIIIPYYKIAFFKETLRSLERQTCKNFKLFIGNDASPENPENLIKDMLKTTAFNYKEYTENFGSQNLVRQWERCIHDSEISEWFQILGDDDVISENFVEEFYKNLSEINQNKCNVVKFSQCWIDHIDEQLNYRTTFPKLFSRLENWKKKFITGERASLSEHIFRTSEFNKYGFQKFPLAWGSDDAAVFDVAGKNPLFFIEKANIYIRISHISISGRSDNEFDKKKGHHYFEEYMISHHFRELPKDRLRHMINHQIVFSYKNNLSLSIPLLKLYLWTGDYDKVLKLPKTYYYLWVKNNG